MEQTGNPMDLVPDIFAEMEKLAKFIDSISKSRRTMLESRTKEYHVNFQTFLENAIYGSAHITKTSSKTMEMSSMRKLSLNDLMI